MTDWKAIARSLGNPSSEEALSRTVAPLEALEPLLARMAEVVAAETDPAILFRPEEPGA